MTKIKLTFTLEIEIPADATVADGNTLAREVRRVLRTNEAQGWTAKLRRQAQRCREASGNHEGPIS